MKAKTRTVVCMAILIAMMLVLGLTPIGYIPLPFASLTLMCLPVLIGTFLLGLRAGFGLALVFILTSLYQLVTKPTALALILLDANPFLTVVALIIPRLLIPVTAWFVYRALDRRWPKASLVVASAAGSLTNTFLYLLLLQIWFVTAIAEGFEMSVAAATGTVWGIVLTNGLPEAALAAVICPLVTSAVAKSVPELVSAGKEQP